MDAPRVTEVLVADANGPVRSAAAPDQHWAAYGLCGQDRAEDLFVTGAAQREARRLCAGCPVRVDCLVDALDHEVEFGVWGGMTERERRALRRARPDVTSWREVLEAEPALLEALHEAFPNVPRPRPVSWRSQ